LLTVPEEAEMSSLSLSKDPLPKGLKGEG